MTSPKSKEVEVLGAERRRRWTVVEKLAMVRETYEAVIEGERVLAAL